MSEKVEIRVTEEFSKCYKKLPEAVQKKVDKQLRFLSHNPKHQSLRIHKMNNEWEFM